MQAQLVGALVPGILLPLLSLTAFGTARLLLQGEEGAPRLSTSGEGRSCNGLTGRFVTPAIVATQQTNEITRFAADLEQHCGATARDSSGKAGYAYPWVTLARDVNNKN